MDKVKAGSSKEFVLINKILYKKCQTPDVFLLCIPQKIASAAAWNLHNLYGFHFSKDHMTNKLRKIIFCPDLDILVQDILNTCPVCTLAPKKALYRQIGSQKSTLYRPLQAVVVDSLYLPSDKLGYSKALLLCDAATGKISIFPEKNLQASTARKSILNYLYCTPAPQFLISDKGSEFEKKLDLFLAQYDITLLSLSSHQKGATSLAEANIKLCKSALRRIQIADPSNWSFSIPLVCQGINESLLYGQV